MKNSKRYLSLLLVLVTVFLVACGSPTNDQETAGETNTQTTDVDSTETGDTDTDNTQGDASTQGSEVTEYTFAGGNSLASMDYVITNKSPDHAYNANFVDGLLEHDRLGQLQGALAEDWEVSEDGLQWTFYLRPGVKWVTNTGLEYAEVVADDFVTGLRHAAEFQSLSSPLVEGLIAGYADYLNSDFSDEAWEQVGVEAVDELTVRYTLESPAPYFGDIATYNILLPINRQFLESREGTQLGNPDPTNSTFGILSPDSILYNGGYVLRSVDEKSSIVIEKNEHYWDADNVYLEEITEIYDDGSDPYSIKNGFENGVYSSMSMRPTWEDYEQIRSEYEEYVRPNLPNATTFGLIFNFNRQVYNNTNYGQDEQLAENTRNAIQNENFRKAFRAAWNRLPELEIDAPTELARQAMRNINNFPEAGIHSDGRNYHEIVTDVYNDRTGEGLDLTDANDPFYSKESALEYIEAAQAEGIEFPVHLDMLVLETSDRLVKVANSMKQTIEENTDGNIIIELVLRDYDTVYALAFLNDDPDAVDYDLNTFSGWGPDYNDPKTYVYTWSPVTGSYMTNAGLGTTDVNGNLENPELKEALGFMEYEELYQQADEIVDNHDQRLEAFAQADSLLIERALFIPKSMAARGELVSKVEPFTSNFSEVGLLGNKYKNVRINNDLVTAEEYFNARDEWQNAREEAASQNNQ